MSLQAARRTLSLAARSIDRRLAAVQRHGDQLGNAFRRRLSAWGADSPCVRHTV